MADFCRECSLHMFGEDYGDLRGLCKPGEVARAVCHGREHGGPCEVHHEGTCRIRRAFQ